MSDSISELPALLGGTPVRPGGPPPWPRPDPEVQAALAEAIASGAWGQYHGEHVHQFERELAAFHDSPHALTCASGTLAVEAAFRALRVGPGDEVVLAAYDYESNFLTVHALGAKPVLVDVAPNNWNLDPQHLEAAITTQTRAVICSHLHGGLVPMREVMEIAGRRGVGVVEDAAQAPGALVQGKPAGTWGDIGTLSFGGSKLLTAGRGGALLIREPQVHQRAKLWLHRGLQQWAPLSELQAAALRPQLAKLRESTRHRAESAARIANPRLGGTVLPAGAQPATPAGSTVPPDPHPGLTAFENTAEESSPAFYKLGFRYDPALFGLSREVFVKAFRAEGIAFDAGFNALHIGRSPSRFRAVGELYHAAAAHAGCVMLHHPVLLGTEAEVRQVAEAIEKVHRHRDRF